MAGFLFALIAHLWASAAQALPTPLDPQRENVLMALQLPLVNRHAALLRGGEDVPEALAGLAFDKSQALGVRWKALTALAMTERERAAPVVERALTSPEWYLRNAGLIAMTYVSEPRALSWSAQLLNDPALVVRTAAVQTLRKLGAREHRDLLWDKLYAKENFKGRQSLWIRRHIVETLAVLARRGEEHRFVRVLADEDASLHRPATEALEKITGLAAPPGSAGERADFWRQWWTENQGLSNIRI
jgi:HEAT repeat protein